MMRGCGGRKFFLPLMMKLPVGRYSPVGAVFETCAKAHIETMKEWPEQYLWQKESDSWTSEHPKLWEPESLA